MKIIPKPPELADQLQQFEVFSSISKDVLQWMINQSEYTFFEAGEMIFEPGQAVDTMQVLVQGEYIVKVMRNNRWRELGAWDSGSITGVLPFSRMKEAKAHGEAVSDCYFLQLHRDHFVEMVNTSYELTQVLVHTMTSRVRDFTQMRFQDEKLMALGKLSAGLAHELNNPASAMIRSSEELYNKIHSTPEKFKAIITMRISPEQTDRINEILFSRIQTAKNLDLSIMEREERADELLDWLEDNEVENAEDIADTLVDFGFRESELDKISEIAEGQYLSPLLWWIESTLSLEKLVEEIREASDRIGTLVGAVKSYSHMDKASTMEPVDIHEGIRSTIMMLKHEFKRKNIQLDKSLDLNLPKVEAFMGELNQVWTNLIVNAIDAMEQDGMLKIRTYPERNMVCVEITDNGIGIPEDIQTRVFEPFFTTKKMGEGTGMGLDIVKKIVEKHHADIFLTSKKGETTFKLCFPKA